MLILNKGKKTEVAVRVFLHSEPYGTDFFDGHESLKECLTAVARLVKSSMKQTQKDGTARQVGIVVLPPSEFDDADPIHHES